MRKKYRGHDDYGFWETFRSLPTWSAKLGYAWDCYNFGIVVGVVLVVMAIMMGVSIYNSTAPIYLSGEYIDVITSPHTLYYDEDYLERAFLREYLGLPEDDRTHMPYTTDWYLYMGNDSKDALSARSMAINRIDTQLAAGEVDYFVLTENAVDFFAVRYNGALMDMNEFLTPEEMELYQDRLLCNKYDVPVAFDITDTDLVKYFGVINGEKIYLSWCRGVRKPENMRPFFEFLLSTTQE